MNGNINNELKKSNDFVNKIEHKFKNNPNFKFKYIITENNDNFGMNDIFEVYKLNKDNMGYIASPNKNNFYLDIYNLLNNEKILSLKEHQNRITSIRYFINNKDNSEYLISSDENKIVIVWDINDNYGMKTKIDTKYGDSIYSSLIIFPNNENDSYIITSTLSCNDISKDSSENIERSATKIYSLNQGKFIDFIKISVYYEIFYLLSWYDKKLNDYYVIQLNKRYVLLNSLKHNNSCNFLKQKKDDIICSGFICIYNDNDYLFCSTKHGFINIWNLNCKNIFKFII
jgi:WD40 repeat protein